MTTFPKLLFSLLAAASISLAFCQTAIAAPHIHPEKHYQRLWCQERQGAMEHRLDDASRVDCLTGEYAVEVEFASKWKEAVGQALFYAIKTGKLPGIVLIVEHPEEDKKHQERLAVVAARYMIKVWIVGP